ncbi:hypothetical protein [Halorubrum sp. GN11_10-6_MGM]|uniref:hypothetical protein n=1 Tax=Halorubrum sp. GN11_10-6_MGM TaxID=2518112 RepID=UPI0026C14C27
MLFEDRPAKLCRRLPYEVESDTQLDLTMSWVIAGPTATTLRDEITTALSEELATVRNAIADGTEAAPTLEIPVVDGTTYPAIRRVIDEIATAHDVQWTPKQKHRLVRLCLRSFGPSDTPQQACPYDVVGSLLRARAESRTPTPADVERAAATLKATRFRPDLTPTATKLYATLLRADNPLGRTEILERADISASSYDRRLEDVRALDRVHAVQVNGHRRWTTTESVHPDIRTPPVTAWLSDHSDQPTPSSSTNRHPATATGPTTPASGHTRWHSHAEWDRRPPISLATNPSDTMCPINTPTDSRQPHSHQQRHQTHPMSPTITPTTAATPPQPPQRDGGSHQ